MLSGATHVATGLIEAARPGMWLKPLFLMLVASTYVLRDLPDLPKLLEGVVIVGPMLWGGLYMLNAITDIEDDRRHPVKRLRPFASGRVQPPLGLAISMALIAAALLCSLGINAGFALCLVLMVAKQVAYTVPPLRLKRLYLLDVLSGSLGNSTLRFAAGWFLFSRSLRLPLLLLVFAECLQLAGFLVNRLFTNYSGELEKAWHYHSTSARLTPSAIKAIISGCWVIGIACFGFLALNSQLGFHPEVLGSLPLQSLVILFLLLAAVPFFARAMQRADRFSYAESQIYYDLPLAYVFVLSVGLSIIIKIYA